MMKNKMHTAISQNGMSLSIESVAMNA